MVTISCGPQIFFQLSQITKFFRSPNLVATKISGLGSLWWLIFFDHHRRLACRIYLESLHWGLSKKNMTSPPAPPPHPLFVVIKNFQSPKKWAIENFWSLEIVRPHYDDRNFFVSTPCNVQFFYHHILWQLTPFSITIMNKGSLGW